MDANQLRRAWTTFWAARGHTVVPSAGLIPHHPTAPLFTNAGMNQFVAYFLGEEPAPYPRAASLQKCVRLSGKHNDIDELGKTRRHLSFFEMLGNFSFGDYFKQDAIAWAWELVTDVIGLDGDRIWATVHETDDDAAAIWHDVIGLPVERIQRMGKENFWEMGDVGPCGTSSELHFDCGPEWGESGGPLHGAGDRYVEFWNLVFMDSFRHPDASLTDLPAKNVDTGGGLERWLMVLDGVRTVFDTDAVRPLVARVEALTGRRYGADPADDVALRVVADQARTTTFLVSDGVTPSNEDRGYVLRSVIRRAVRLLYQLGVTKPVLPALVDGVVELMGEAYPELVRNRDAIATVVAQEEDRFRETLRAGSALLDQELRTGKVSGEVAFKLHDTFGFPVEITEEVASEQGIPVDRPGFDGLMADQRQRAKASRRTATVVAGGDAAYRDILSTHGPTEFTGYAEYSSKGQVLHVLEAAAGSVEIFLDRTPFYAEGGGQVGDTGTIETESGRADVLDTTAALPGLYRHTARIIDGTITPGQEATATIDGARREATRRNHTATHLLHWALRQMFGPQLRQQSSYVGPDRLRFDFNHPSPMSREEIDRLEDLVNAHVLADEPVRAFETTKAEAELLGAIAFFGDKYGDIVRVVEAGKDSRELCGGTHVRALGTIGPFKVISEGSIGSNLRRIEATTGTATLERVRAEEEVLEAAALRLRSRPEELVDAVDKMLARTKSLEDELKTLRSAGARARAGELAGQAVDGVVVSRVDALDQNALKDLAVAVRDQPGVQAAVLIGSPDGQRAALVAAVRPDSGFVASDLIADAARTTGGGGGRQADLATAGGRDASRMDEALEQIRAAVKKR